MALGYYNFSSLLPVSRSEFFLEQTLILDKYHNRIINSITTISDIYGSVKFKSILPLSSYNFKNSIKNNNIILANRSFLIDNMELIS